MRFLGFRRVVTVLVLVCIIAAGLPIASAEDTLSLASEAVVLMDAQTGQILYEKNMHQQLYPASITKVMTAMLALETLERQQVLTVSKEAVQSVPITSSHISLKAGEQITVNQALYAIGMESANDAANVLATAVSGSLEAFAQRMTDKAKVLGAFHTNFTNANGLTDKNHYTTAYDMALITAAALKVPGLSEYFSTTEYLLPATNLSDVRTFQNKDRLLPGGQYAYPGVILAKTGWTTAAQGTFVAAVQQGQTTLIVVALKSPQLEDKYKDTTKLMNYGFSHYTRTALTGEEAAASLDIGEFVAVSGQVFPFLLPVGSARTDLRFALAEGTHIPEGVERCEITVNAMAGDEMLYPLHLKLTLPGLDEPETEPTEAIDEIVEIIEQEVKRGLPLLAIAAGIAAFLSGWMYMRKRHMKKNRRKQLDARIRRMKKQSE